MRDPVSQASKSLVSPDVLEPTLKFHRRGKLCPLEEVEPSQLPKCLVDTSGYLGTEYMVFLSFFSSV